MLYYKINKTLSTYCYMKIININPTSPCFTSGLITPATCCPLTAHPVLCSFIVIVFWNPGPSMAVCL